MSEFSTQPIKTFNLSYADSPGHKSDVYYARKISDRYATKHHEYVMKWADLQTELPNLIYHLDQPSAGVISSYWLSRFMRQYITVALSGDGADDIFASYGHHRLVWPITAIQKARAQGRPTDEVDFGFFQKKKDLVFNLAERLPWEWRCNL